MELDTHHWMTLHRVRFVSEVSALEQKFSAPGLPECWRFCPTLIPGPNGLPTLRSDVWYGLGIYSGREQAELMVAAARSHLPFLAGAVEQWHALLLPFMHRGEVNWRGSVENGTAVRPAPDQKAGLLAVITSAGYNTRTPDQVPRIARFSRGIQDVVDFYREFDGNIRAVCTAGGFDHRDGFTASLWRDNDALTTAAYGGGTHRTLMDASRDGSLFDRSSFTRARIVASSGSWDGEALAG